MAPLHEDRAPGQGPVNQNHSDSEILVEITRRFANNPYLKERDITAFVTDGVATLEGFVFSPPTKQLAEDILADVPGLREIHNNLIVTASAREAGENIDGILGTVDGQPISEASNKGDTSLHHPTTTGFSEVTPLSREERIVGSIDTGYEAGEAIPTPIPLTGEEMSVMDAGAADAMKISGDDLDADSLRHRISEGMHVLDREGKQVGKVKQVRQTDFLLHRTLARNVYVPYEACDVNGENVVLSIRADEIGDQGWAMPHLF